MKRLIFVLSLTQVSAFGVDRPSQHNMVGFGAGPYYLSHLPMYEHPVHRYQAVYEVKLSATPKSKLFGISPGDLFTMPQLKSGSKFKADLHPGHPETVASNATGTVEVLNVIYFAPLKPSGSSRPSKLTYFKSGSGASGEIFLSHLLTTPTVGSDTAPDQFDQILAVKAVPEQMGGATPKIPDGTVITFSRNDIFSDRLVKSASSTDLVKGSLKTGAASDTVGFLVLDEIYLHTDGDVRVDSSH